MYYSDDGTLTENYLNNPEFEADDSYNPGLGAELLLSENPNPLASTAMSLAGDLRQQGYSPSAALKEGWRQAKGESEDNPTFEPSALLMVLATAGAFIGIWKLVKHVWPWQSWGLDRKQIMARPIQRISPQATAERQRYNVSPIPSDRTEERVTLITP